MHARTYHAGTLLSSSQQCNSEFFLRWFCGLIFLSNSTSTLQMRRIEVFAPRLRRCSAGAAGVACYCIYFQDTGTLVTS
jgi:hypothetical protein